MNLKYIIFAVPSSGLVKILFTPMAYDENDKF
jgi:hypothetical protein